MDAGDGATQVDYRCTSRRPSWDLLPAAVRTAVQEAAGEPVVAAAPPVTSGFTGSYAGRVALAGGSQRFVKAGGPGMPHVVEALSREARVLRELPTGMPAPRLIASGAVDGWSFLVLAVVAGEMPGLPWSAPDVAAVHRACLAVAELGTPGPATLAGDTLADQLAMRQARADLQRSVAAAVATAPARDGLRAWLPRRFDELWDLSERGPELLDGDTLVHGDLRPDNLLVDPGGAAVLVDWNWVSRGPRWADLVGLWPLMAYQGVDVEALARHSPLLAGVDPDAVDCFLALLALYMVDGFPHLPPPGCTPAIRAHQRLVARATLSLLSARRGWS